MSAADPAHMKGEAAAQPEDAATPELTLATAAEHGYLAADAHRAAFVQDFLSALEQ